MSLFHALVFFSYLLCNRRLVLEEHWHKCCIACPSSGDLVAYSRDKENTVNILNYKTCVMLHIVILSDLKSVDAMTVSSSGLVYVVEYDGGPIVSFELTTGQNMRQIAGGERVQMTSTLQATPDAKYDKFRPLN